MRTKGTNHAVDNRTPWGVDQLQPALNGKRASLGGLIGLFDQNLYSAPLQNN